MQDSSLINSTTQGSNMHPNMRFMFNGQVPEEMMEQDVDRQEVLADEILIKIVRSICKYYVNRDPTPEEIDSLADPLHDSVLRSIHEYLLELCPHMGRQLAFRNNIHVLDPYGKPMSPEEIEGWLVKELCSWSG